VSPDPVRYLYLHPGGRITRHPVLSRRTRLRLAVRRRIDIACCRLVEHGYGRAAVWIWRACGMWPR
jgi:hypothetical protein